MGTFGSVEIIALALILFSLVKLVVVLIRPGAWLAFARSIYARPPVTSAVALALAAVVLLALIAAGMTIVQILAVFALQACIMVAGVAPYGNDLVHWAERRDPRGWLREQWLLTLIWIGLLVWGLAALFVA